ncbi:MAG: PKD domain-containing protein, partial [Chitinophagales bacterium]
SQNEANSVEFQFNYQRSNCAGTANATTDQVAQTSTLICTDGALDYTLLQLPVNPTNTYGFLSLRSSGPAVNERIYIPQHPGGQLKKISVNDDQSTSGFAQVININGGGNGTRTEYYSDTDNGSSGSPVISYNDHLVVALHNTGGCLNGGNRADAIINDMGACLPNNAVDNPGNIVLAAFSMDTEKSCDGAVNFINQSFNAVNYYWDFGDGNSSSLENPSQTYTSTGTFDVQLIVEDSSGVMDTTSRQVYVAMASSPTVSSDTICANNTAQLSAVGSGGNLYWYETPSGGNAIDSGAVFTSPVLNSNTSYYVEERENTPVQNLGEANNNISTGQYFTANDLWGCLFDVELPLVLKSVKVYAGSAGNRNIVLEQNGNTIEAATINIPAGESRVDLNFEVNPGLQYLLKIDGTVDLYRNSGGANYPYSIPGLISITGNNTTTGNADDYYYYFYDWEVQELPCISPRTEVDVIVTNPPNVNADVNDANCQGRDGSVELTISGGAQPPAYVWSTGDTGQIISNLQPGTYYYTVSTGSNCETTGSANVGSGGQQP